MAKRGGEPDKRHLPTSEASVCLLTESMQPSDKEHRATAEWGGNKNKTGTKTRAKTLPELTLLDALVLYGLGVRPEKIPSSPPLFSSPNFLTATSKFPFIKKS